jgi:hypothetical protein
MKEIGFETLDGNEAVARVAFQLNEAITPASPMGEWADAWATVGVKNLKQAQQNVDARWQQYQRLAGNGTKEDEKVTP